MDLYGHTLRNILSLPDIITFVSPAKNKHGWIIYPTIALEDIYNSIRFQLVFASESVSNQRFFGYASGLPLSDLD